MADNTATTLKMARLLALGHIVVGVLLFIFGIVDRVHGYFWSGEGCFGIWCGIWVRRIKLICTLKQQHFYKYVLISAVTRARARMSKKKPVVYYLSLQFNARFMTCSDCTCVV